MAPGEDLTHVSQSAMVDVRLHPMVILNISEHWTRFRMVSEDVSAVKVFGVLLGKQDVNQLEIISSIELLLDDQGSIDTEFFETRESQCKQVHPDLDFIGCYVTGGVINEQDEAFFRQIKELCESSVILKLDPYEKRDAQLPIRIYESSVDSDARVLFKMIKYEMAHDEAERIGVDHVAKSNDLASQSASSLTADQLSGSYHAIQMLHNRLQVLRAYVKAVQEEQLPMNHARLRAIHGLVRRLPFLVSGQQEEAARATRKQLHRQANEVCLTTLLCSITQGLETLQATVTKSLAVIDRRPVLQPGRTAYPSSRPFNPGFFKKGFGSKM